MWLIESQQLKLYLNSMTGDSESCDEFKIVVLGCPSRTELRGMNQKVPNDCQLALSMSMTMHTLTLTILN
jgi:hypothetical protein